MVVGKALQLKSQSGRETVMGNRDTHVIIKKDQNAQESQQDTV